MNRPDWKRNSRFFPRRLDSDIMFSILVAARAKPSNCAIRGVEEHFSLKGYAGLKSSAQAPMASGERFKVAEEQPTREETMRRLMAGYERVIHFRRDTPYTVADRLEQQARDNPDKPFIIFEDQVVTFAEANAFANRVAHAAVSAGFARDDVVSLLMHNRPEYILTWLGLSKAGIVAALLNTSATGKVLLNALDQAKSKGLIFGTELADSVAAVDREHLPPILLSQAETGSETSLPHGAINLNSMIDQASAENPDPSIREGILMGDPLYLIFTSGTTGLPKAAIVSHLRFIAAGETQGGIQGMGQDDVHYCVLPLYHGAGGMVVVSIALAFTIPFVLRRRFSVSAFWDDVRKHRITAVQYIGEICRYLLNAPASPDDRNHTLRKMSGAGLKSEVWRRFSDRYGVDDIYEGLGGTECNYNIINVDRKIGSVGRIPYPERSTVRVIAYDFEAEGYFYDENGCPRLADPGEVGELIAQVLPGPKGAGFYEGYTCPNATEAKLMRDVFMPGDIWFRSGDLVKFDAEGYFFFVDRVGDTFRWKSENVSTEEVAIVLGTFPGPELVNVYGVEIPGTEGRAGMAALTYADANQFDPKAFYAFAQANLAPYAMPVFIRIAAEARMTTTFKMKKIDLQKEGYDPALVGSDKLYVLDPDRETYSPLNAETLSRIGINTYKSEGINTHAG